VYTRNRGIVFGLMSEGEVEWRAFFLIGINALVMAFVIAILWQYPPRGMTASRLTRLGLALVLGGALGNLYDRLLEGSVIDFLSFHAGSFYWPAFNVADSGITVGVCLILLDLWRNRRRPLET
jgi:signal peptidase II